MDRFRAAVAGVVLAGTVAGLVAPVASSPGIGIVAGFAVAIPLLRSDSLADERDGFDWASASVASVGALAVGALLVTAANALTTNDAALVGLGAGGAIAGSYVGDGIRQLLS